MELQRRLEEADTRLAAAFDEAQVCLAKHESLDSHGRLASLIAVKPFRAKVRNVCKRYVAAQLWRWHELAEVPLVHNFTRMLIPSSSYAWSST